MEAGKVQIDFDEGPPVASVTLHLKSSTAACSAGIIEMNPGPKPAQSDGGAIREEAARPNHLPAAAKLVSCRAQPIRWGINE